MESDRVKENNRSTTSTFDLKNLSVDYSLEGWVTINSGLVLLEGHRVLLRRDYRNLKTVRLLSGGCSGFEPLYSGFVGPGMLTAAVVGDKYSWPPYPSILAAIRELSVNNPYGILIILNNNPQSKINFSLAVDYAVRDGIPVKMLFVCDDSSGLICQRIGKKGLVGVTMIFKIAGAMAEQNKSLEEIYNVCSSIATSDIGTVSVNVNISENYAKSIDEIASCGNDSKIDNDITANSCDNSEETLKKTIQIVGDIQDTQDIYTGTYSFTNAMGLAKTILGYLIDGTLSSSSLVVEPDRPVVILLNNYGVMMNLELSTLAYELYQEITRKSIQCERSYIGSLMTCRFFSGFSVTVMKVSKEIIECLDYPTCVSGWPSHVLHKVDEREELQKHICGDFHWNETEPKLLGPILSKPDADKMCRVLEFVAMALISCEEQINKIGANCNMSLYGTHIRMGADALSRAIFEEKLSFNCPYACLQQLSTLCSYNLTSMCGSLYSVFFDAASQTFLQYFNQTAIKSIMWCDALESGIQAIEYYTKLERGDRSLLDALYPMLEVFKQNPESYVGLADAAELGSLDTVDRDNRAHSLPDPGSHTVAIWARAAVEGLNTFFTLNQETNSTCIEYDSDISVCII